MALTQSDWIAIGVGAAQILAALAIATWTIRKTQPVAQAATVSAARPGRTQLLRRMLVYWTGIVVAVLELVYVFQQPEPVSKISLFIALFALFILAVNVGAITFFTHVHETNAILKRIVDHQTDMIELQTDVAQVVGKHDRALTRSSTRARGKRTRARLPRAG